MEPRVRDITALGRYVAGLKPLDDERFRTKRIFDILISVISLILLSPLIALAAVLIKIESRGPAFFKQERIGLNRRTVDRRRKRKAGYSGEDRRIKRERRKDSKPGKPFVMYKMRTMQNNAEEKGPKLASKDDSRITRVGRFLRRTRIDEIPQFLNVIKGDMSIVGPRPERSFYIRSLEREIPEFTLRLRTKPGITGLAQVEGGYANSVEKMSEKLTYDLKYISSLSVAEEIKILFKTFYVVISGKGAY